MLRQVQSDRSNLAHGWLPFAADSITAVWHSDAARGPSTPSFDHLVGAREQRRRHFDAQRLGRFQIDHQLVLGRLLEGQIASLLATQDTINIRCSASVLLKAIRAVRDQAAGRHEYTLRNRLPVSDAAQSSRWSAP